MRSPGIAVALGLSLLISASAYLTWQQYVKTSDRTRHTTAVIGDTKELLTDVLDAESSARGFLLSGDEETFARFTAASAAARGRSERLAGSRGDFAGQQQLLSDLKDAIDQKLRRVELAVEGSRDLTPARTVSKRDMEEDGALLATIRILNVRAEDQLQRSLRTSRDRSRFFAGLAEWTASLGCVGIFTIVLLSQVRIQRLGASRLRLNDELTAANEDLRQFVYSASHDLQEPLRVLLLYSDLIDRNVQVQRPVANELGHLRRAAKQMSALLHDLLSYTQVVSGPKNIDAASDLKVETEKAIQSLRASVDETQAELAVGELPVVPMESAHALLLMQNLIGNSLKYRKAGLAPRVTILAERVRGKWVISVADNGIGVEPVYHQEIFGIFKRLHTRTAYPGTGLGLAISRRIVERYGGTIWVESGLGTGSTFRFSVPDRSRS